MLGIMLVHASLWMLLGIKPAYLCNETGILIDISMVDICGNMATFSRKMENTMERQIFKPLLFNELF